MNFTWDENKADSNLIRHGISFEEAMLVFADPFLLINQDRIENGKMWCQSIGEIEGIAVILVAHTWHDKDGEEYIRIISARPADKREKKRYEQNRYSSYWFKQST